MIMTIKEQLDSLRGQKVDGDAVSDIFSSILLTANELSNVSTRLQNTYTTPEELETVLEIRHARNDLMDALQKATELARGPVE